MTRRPSRKDARAVRPGVGMRVILRYAVALVVAGPALNARAIGSEFQINTFTTSYQRVPAVAPDGAGGFVVVWQSIGLPDSIQGQRFAGDGTPLGGEFQVNTVDPAEATNEWPDIGPDGAGGLVVVWERRLLLRRSRGVQHSGATAHQRRGVGRKPVSGERQHDP